MSKYGRQRRVSTRVRGLELNLLETCGLTYGELVRYGLKKYYEEHPKSNEHIIVTEIAFLRDKIEECELEIEATKLLIQDRLGELKEIKESKENSQYWYIVNNIYDTYLEFIDDESLSDEYRSDLNNFYINRRDKIEIIAMQAGHTFEQAINIFESYLDFKFGGEDMVDMELDAMENSLA